MTTEKITEVIAALRRKADAGLRHSDAGVEYLCKEAERLVERVRELETELRVSQLRARSAGGIAGLSLPQVIQALRDS